MLNRIRERFGTAGLVVSIMALVLALAGGAFAASGGLNAKQKKQVKAIAKSFQGTGPAGAPGLAGLAGAKGDPGAAGAAGADGSNGTNGQSVTVTNENPGGNCADGGKKLVSVSGTSYVCNGAVGTNGDQGPAGSPWTLGGTLPGGSTETGTFAYAGPKNLSPNVYPAFGANVQISFPIPLAGGVQCEVDPGPPPVNQDQGLCSDHVVYIPFPDSNPNCPGTIAEPAANSGYLCIYEGIKLGLSGAATVYMPDLSNTGASVSGALLTASGVSTTQAPFWAGTWAVAG